MAYRPTCSSRLTDQINLLVFQGWQPSGIVSHSSVVPSDKRTPSIYTVKVIISITIITIISMLHPMVWYYIPIPIPTAAVEGRRHPRG